jgi:hypothetical protein
MDQGKVDGAKRQPRGRVECLIVGGSGWVLGETVRLETVNVGFERSQAGHSMPSQPAPGSDHLRI